MLSNKSASMKKYLVLCLGVMSVLLTGCPHNQYIVELTPRDKVIERELTFYREDGTGKDGAPNYQTFPTNELAAISKLYPPGSVTDEKERHRAKGQLANALPSDVGGAGAYTNLNTSLGSAGFYMERFRGDDDLAGSSAERMKAADQLVDLIVGWSKMELEHEPHYEDLRKFLDVDFRKDVKNVGLYAWTAEVASTYKTGATEEFCVRFGQYLVEHGYLKLQDWPDVLQVSRNGGEQQLMRMIQRLVATKLGVPEAKPVPSALAFLADEVAIEKSWDNYLTTTELYRAKVEEWEKKKLTEPNLEKPKSSEVTGELFEKMIHLRLFGETDDHLTVRLSLLSAPIHTNGRWDETQKKVVWESELEAGKEPVRLPAFCYASWSNANEAFQKEHFGKVLLVGDGLSEYCMWRSGLNEKEAEEWEGLLVGLKSGEGMVEKLDAFRFSEEAGSKENPQPTRSDVEVPRRLFKEALKSDAQ
ncbi:MAG: hypothetical protein JWQ71_3914 [Pedosphaera sp.]|nr:hypothetical protein [Pedosphaera sp.]